MTRFWQRRPLRDMDVGVAIPARVELGSELETDHDVHARPAPAAPPPTDLPVHLEGAIQGDRAAAQALAVELIPRIRNLVRYLARSADIDDVSQEALVTVLRKLALYRPIGSFNAWVDRIVVRVTFAELRRERRGARHTVSDAIDGHEMPSPDLADAYATRARIAAALDELSVEQRFAVVMHHVLGMSASEIGEEMGAPLETIRSRLRLGMQSLRRSMTTTEEGGSQ